MNSLPPIQFLGFEIDAVIAIPVFAFIAISLGTWALIDLFGGRNQQGKRLDILNRASRPELDEKVTGLARVKQMLVGTFVNQATQFSEHMKPTSEKDIQGLRAKLTQAGFRSPEAQSIYLGSKLVGLLGGAALGGGIFLILNGFTTATMIRVGICAGLFFYLPDLYIWYRGRSRKDQIFLGLPDVLDLLVVCVEAGLGLDQAMRKVSEEMKRSFPVLSEEFSLCTMQMQMGRKRSEAMTELGQRSGVDDLRVLATIVIQAEKFGSSIAQALRVQSDTMRTKRKQIAEEKAAKTAVQLIFPLVLFIFPAIFVVLVGPAAITVVNEMLPMMGNAGQ